MSITAPATHASEPTEWLARLTRTRSDAAARIAWLTGVLGSIRWAPALCVPLRPHAVSETTTDHDPFLEPHRRTTA